jgi:hypothetical protein
MVMVIVGERLWGSRMWDGLVESVKEPTEMVNSRPVRSIGLATLWISTLLDEILNY